MSMMRAKPDGERPRAHAPLKPPVPPEPDSSVKIRKSLPLYVKGFACCACPPSTQNIVPTTFIFGLGRRNWNSLMSMITRPLGPIDEPVLPNVPGCGEYMRVPCVLNPGS